MVLTDILYLILHNSPVIYSNHLKQDHSDTTEVQHRDFFNYKKVYRIYSLQQDYLNQNKKIDTLTGLSLKTPVDLEL